MEGIIALNLFLDFRKIDNGTTCSSSIVVYNILDDITKLKHYE